MPSVAVLTNDLQYGLVQLKEDRAKAVAEATPRLSGFYEKMRSLKIPVIHLQHINDPDDPVSKRLYNGNFPVLKGSDGAKIIKDFYRDGDILVEKHKPSGFYASDLDKTLKDLGVKSVIITGFQTQICVQTTAADAYFRGYNVIVPSDGVVATFEADTVRALQWLKDYFADIFSCETIYKRLEQHEDFEPKRVFKGV